MSTSTPRISNNSYHPISMQVLHGQFTVNKTNLYRMSKNCNKLQQGCLDIYRIYIRYFRSKISDIFENITLFSNPELQVQKICRHVWSVKNRIPTLLLTKKSSFPGLSKNILQDFAVAQQHCHRQTVVTYSVYTQWTIKNVTLYFWL